MTASDSDGPFVTRTNAHWVPRMRGAVTIIGGMLAYTALASAFGESPTYLTALVGLLGSLAAIVWVWWLEMRRSRQDDAKLRADQPAP